MLYEMLINFGIFSFLWFYLRKRGHKDGFIFASYLTLYSIGRFIVEHFRADSLMMDSLKAAQAVSLTVAALGIIMIFAKRLWKP